ncbi:MAG: RNA ligase (ATP) [Clostridiales bacterium]|nr:RNA ligase (ATP) [Clostridiales bacterium]
MRNLVTIQEIAGTRPIPDADAIELVLIKGWQCVAKKGEFAQGDLCVYYEVDSFLPIDERYEFLRKTSYRNNEFMGEGFRIKTVTFRGEISQGLALPLGAFGELAGFSAGADVTENLGVRKWEQPEVAGSSGVELGDKPYGIPTTDETRLQSMPEFLDAFRGKPYYITTKMDGTSCTVYCKDGKVGVCGRNKEYKEETQTCAMWAWVYKRGIKEKLLALGEDIAIQGEFCGAGIQKNRLKLMEPNIFAFDVIKFGDDGTLRKEGLDGLLSYCGKLGIDPVPVEEAGDSFDYTLEELIEKAKGKYGSGLDKEGIVVRTKEYGRMPDINHKLSFKVLNNDFLKKDKG